MSPAGEIAWTYAMVAGATLPAAAWAELLPHDVVRWCIGITIAIVTAALVRDSWCADDSQLVRRTDAGAGPQVRGADSTNSRTDRKACS